MKIFLLTICAFVTIDAAAQDTVSRVLTIKQLFALTEANAKQLSIAHQNIDIGDSKVDVAKSDRLPEIGTSADIGYLSTIAILNPDFSFHSNVPTPHLSNNYFVGASEVIYKGGYVRHNVSRAKLSVELAGLNYDKDAQEIKLLLLGRYLELYELYNSTVIYKKNIQLSRRRLSDLEKLNKEGLVTGNDLIRSRLQIADFGLDLDHLQNNITIVNNELAVVLGLSPSTKILPDTTLTDSPLHEIPLEGYLQSAYTSQPEMKVTRINEKISEQNVALEKSARMPAISLYAGDALQRPFLLTLEPLDIYYNAYQAGLKVQYNISSIYHAKDKIRLANLELAQQRTKTEWQKQQTEIAVTTAFTRYNEAKQDFQTLQKSLDLADDNFRVVQKKYINQLAQITDMLDASTSKLAAELRLNNARINIINQWYRLQKASGNF
ncbi:TolC family protein [Mucilaginibacter sp. BJC16-A38]|uniref:TolC family protein n=1 Tax=Mucilaginibacter phenanthrenivorans TaxID=1234842 RepID=UPI00215746E7|nr:TolC family protein [Mucilaginibacter phenanthrenivorans]MCR8560333.1 TolC family protein [Mucilaginibacter phenanthrenivorans]